MSSYNSPGERDAGPDAADRGASNAREGPPVARAAQRGPATDGGAGRVEWARPASAVERAPKVRRAGAAWRELRELREARRSKWSAEGDAAHGAHTDAHTEAHGRGMAPHTRVARASTDGVWTAALFLVAISFVIVAWFLGAPLAIDGARAGVAGADELTSRVLQSLLVIVGTLAVIAGLACALLLSRAPRLGRRRFARSLRFGGVAGAVLASLFLVQYLFDADGIAGDLLAAVAAAAPAAMMAEISFALPAITKGRYGVSVAWLGGIAWGLAGAAVILLVFLPGLWWLPGGLAVVAALRTAPGALRVWRHYEGEVVAA